MKKLSRNEMKKVMGGSAPLNPCLVICGGQGGDAWQCSGPSTGSFYRCTDGSYPAPIPSDVSCGLLAHCQSA